jgi:hypothetical protein
VVVKLDEIRNRTLLAVENMKRINPPIKCYLVIAFNCIQFLPSDLTISNRKLVDLLKRPGIFLPGQDIENLRKTADRITRLKDKTPKKPEEDGLMHDLLTTFMISIEKCDFHEPQCELRFYSLDMEKIQGLKTHPIVREIGKTDMSEASINVVIG